MRRKEPWKGGRDGRYEQGQRNVMNQVPNQNANWPCSKHENLPECNSYLHGSAFGKDAFAASTPALGRSSRLIAK